jgi:UDP-N-acetylmuramate--alanine ligase
VYIDDYAHHQRKLTQYIKRLENYIPIKVLALFQPHLFRTKDFADDFAKSLSQFDELLLDIYPARELPMEGITSEWLLGKVDHKNKS